jgi:hypothetical protein
LRRNPFVNLTEISQNNHFPKTLEKELIAKLETEKEREKKQFIPNSKKAVITSSRGERG